MERYERCSECHGLGEVVTGESHLAGACAAAWGTCPACHGTKIEAVGIYACATCLDTGIDLEAPVNLDTPPICPTCHGDAKAA